MLGAEGGHHRSGIADAVVGVGGIVSPLAFARDCGDIGLMGLLKYSVGLGGDKREVRGGGDAPTAVISVFGR